MQGAGDSNMFLPRFEDEAGHFGDALPDAAADRYLAAGAACVIVKNGPAPVVFVEAGHRGAVEVMPAPNVVYTTSAGDSFNAGFLATFGTDMPMADRITLASTVAGQVIGGKGALAHAVFHAMRGWEQRHRRASPALESPEYRNDAAMPKGERRDVISPPNVAPRRMKSISSSSINLLQSLAELNTLPIAKGKVECWPSRRRAA